MKNCPFISHMIGEDGTNVLEAGASIRGNDATDTGVVILGYDGDDGGSVATATKTRKKGKAASAKKKQANDEQSHLFCLKDTCRFYRKKGAACTFDVLFEMTETQSKNAAKKPAVDPAEKSIARITKELDKFWKFQTRSASELIASFGDAEKKQEATLAELATTIREALLESSDTPGAQPVEALREDVARLSASIADREEIVENFSTTISELVINIEDGMKAIAEQTSGLSERVEAIGPTAPDAEQIVSRVVDAVERTLAGHTADAAPPADRTDDVLERLDEIAKNAEASTHEQSEWRERFDTYIETITELQERQQEELASLRETQARVLELLESRPSPEDDQTRERRREARKLNNLGVRSFHNGDLTMAREQFEQAVELAPGFAEAYNNLGLVFTELDERDAATKAFEQAIAANPDLHTAYSNLGYVYYREADYERAAQLYTDALEHREDSSSNWTNLGNARFHLGDHDGARAAWQRALEIDPDNATARESMEKLDG